MRITFLERCRRAAVFFGGLSLICGSQAFADDGCATAASCGTAQDAACCDKLFEETGEKLSKQLGSLVDRCCAPKNACGAADDCSVVDNACGDGCGASSCSDGLGGMSLTGLMGGDDSGITFGGWTQFGYTNRSTGLFNTHTDNVNLHQQWFYAEKIADGSCGLDWGFRADVMYGVDAADTQAFGNNPGRWDYENGFDYGIYGWALPQLYAELAEGDWSVKIGHFYTLVGYEVVTAPDNFFYSHSFTMYNSEPFTHTGAIASYSMSEDTTIYAGWTAGWDTGFDQFDNGSNFLGGFSTAINCDVTLTYITTVGDFGFRGKGYGHSIVVDANVTDKLNYVFQSDVLNTDAGDDHSVGVNQFLFYTISDELAAGGRMEWWKYDGNSQYATTIGLNVKPMDNVIVRPELRWNWNPGMNQDAETIFGVDAILTY